MKRRKTLQENRAQLDETADAIDHELIEYWWLEDELRELEDYIRGINRWLYLYNSPWFEYDAPSWVCTAGLDEQTWWRVWAECPRPEVGERNEENGSERTE